MRANESLSELRAAAVHWIDSDKRVSAPAGEIFAYRITTYRAPITRLSEITLDSVHLEDIKAYTYFALSGAAVCSFLLEIWTNDLTRRLLRIDSEKVGYDNALKTLTEFLSKH